MLASVTSSPVHILATGAMQSRLDRMTIRIELAMWSELSGGIKGRWVVKDDPELIIFATNTAAIVLGLFFAVSMVLLAAASVVVAVTG